MIPISNHVEQERNAQRMQKMGITKVIEINKPEKLLKLINETIETIENIKIDEEIYNKFTSYDGRKNALNIIENNNNQIKHI